MPLSDEIKRLREKKDYSQRKLAYLSGVSNTEISRIENGERPKPSPNVLEKIAPHLGVSHNYLMKLAGHLPEESGVHPTSDPRDIIAAHRKDNKLNDLPPEAIAELEQYIDFIKHKYKKQSEDKK